MCVKHYHAQRRAKNPEKHRAAVQRYRARQRQDADAYSEWTRDTNLKRFYGITAQQYDAQYVRQCGLCALCQTHKDETLAVDHCHETGKVRGLLCGNCNNGLGRFKDNVQSLSNAIAYLNSGGAFHE